VRQVDKFRCRINSVAATGSKTGTSNMNTLMTRVARRRIEVDVPPDWPDGIEVEINPLRKGVNDDEWRRLILETAGKWRGEFERPEQDEYEERESLS
jgi:hypothetical protein